MSNIGQKIKQRRLSLEMTQEELAFKYSFFNGLGRRYITANSESR